MYGDCVYPVHTSSSKGRIEIGTVGNPNFGASFNESLGTF